MSWRIAVTNTDSGASESLYGAGYWDALRQAADELEAVLDGREIPPAFAACNATEAPAKHRYQERTSCRWCDHFSLS